MATNTVDFTQVEEAIRGMRFLVSTRLEGFTIMHTCAPGKDVHYNRFVMFTHKIRNDKTNKIVCYITYRSKLPSKDEAPIFSSYEIFDSDYHSLNKFHVDYTDGSLGQKTLFAAYNFVTTLLV